MPLEALLIPDNRTNSEAQVVMEAQVVILYFLCIYLFFRVHSAGRTGLD